MWVAVAPIIMGFGYWRYHIINTHLEKSEYPLESGIVYIMIGVVIITFVTLALVAVSFT
jgi:uncharacterized membrane protein